MAKAGNNSRKGEEVEGECISNKGKGITIQIHKGLGAHQVSSQVENLWNGLPAEDVEASTLIVFERRSDTTLKEYEWKFSFKSKNSPVANQSSKPISVT